MEAGDLLDEAVDFEDGFGGVDGEEAVFPGVGDGVGSLAEHGFLLRGGGFHGLEEEAWDGIRREVGEDKEPEAVVLAEFLEAGLPGDEDGARRELFRALILDAEIGEPGEEIGGFFLVAGDVVGEAEGALIDETGGLMDGEGEAIEEIGEDEGFARVLGGVLETALRELEQ